MTQLLDKGQELMLVVQTLYKPHDLEGTELHKAPNKMMKSGLQAGRSGRWKKWRHTVLVTEGQGETWVSMGGAGHSTGYSHDRKGKCTAAILRGLV